MLYTVALPFSLTKNPHFCKFVQKYANDKLASYVPPTYNRLKTNLPVQEKTQVDLPL